MQIFGKTITFIPAAVAEGNQTELRVDKYGGIDVIARLDAQEGAASEGSFYVARAAAAVSGTGVLQGIQVTFSDTANPNIVLQNGGSTKTIIPQYIKARVTNIGGGTITNIEAGIEVDSTNRYTSGGSALTGLPTNPSASSPATAAVIHTGAITAAAAGTGRAWVTQNQIRNTVPVANDVYTWVFGALGSGAVPDSTMFPASTISRVTIPVPSVAIPPTGSMLLHLVHVGNTTTGPSYEFEIGYIER